MQGNPVSGEVGNASLRPDEIQVVIGGCAIVLGGLTAAATGPLDIDSGSWLAAYLVLVCGAAQYAIGRVPGRIGAPAMSGPRGWSTLACWNLGNAAVIGGTLAATPIVVDIGAGALVAALVFAWLQVQQVGVGGRRVPRAAPWTYRLALTGLLVGSVVGMVLAHVRHPG
jgi:hypothetical protein